ncbi:MAG: acyl-CoA dehydrogenase family protein, partial [Quisquiliibacterium sp.]
MTQATRLEDVLVPLGEDFPEIRESVRRICANFPGAYWRDLEQREAYPTEFVGALTQAGYLAALIPEEYGGAGLPLRAAAAILEEIHASGCNAGPCHAQMYIMGTLLRHGSAEQKSRYLPKIATGELRLQAFGVTEPTSGTDTTKLKTRAVRNGDHYVVHGQKVWTSRALHSDLMLLLARTTPLDQVNDDNGFDQDLRNRLGERLFDLLARQIFQLHAVHCDPHPGNFAFRSDGSIVFYDFGAVKRLPEEDVALMATLTDA